jgi:hypothetical protein
MAEEKNYAKGCWAREKVFSNGNSIITLSGNTEEFCAWLRSITDDKGQFKIGVSKRREIIEGKPTHTVWQDTWKPVPRADAPAVPKSDPPPWGAATQAQPEDQLPF